MNARTVEKIGGTTMSNPAVVLDNVLIGRRKASELYHRIFVVSAYAGITNALLENKRSGAPGVFSRFAGSDSQWDWGDVLSEAGHAMQAVNRELFREHAHRRVADQFVRERVEGVRSCLVDLQRLCSYGHFNLETHLDTVRELLASIGEAHSAHNTTLMLQQRGVNARFVDLTGWRDESQPSLDERISQALEDVDLASELPIVTGFAHCREGMVKQFGRGYSEVTFSRIAVLTDANEAIIHKEFHLSSADPTLVGHDGVRTIGKTNYDVADQLANMGMEAIHPRAAKCLRQANIPLWVKNAFEPAAIGTSISSDYISSTPQAEIITGIKGVYALEFFEQDMVGVKGYDAAILESLQRHRVRIITKASNANTIVHYLSGSLTAIKRVVRCLKSTFNSADIRLRQVAIVSAIGSDLDIKGLTARAVNCLAEAGIEVLGVHQLLRNVDILFVIEESDFQAAIIALHAALIDLDNVTKSKIATEAA